MFSKCTQLNTYKRNLSSMTGLMQGRNIYSKDGVADREHSESKNPWELTKILGTTLHLFKLRN